MNFWHKKGNELLEEINKTEIPENMLALWFLGQETFVVKYKDKITYIDPFLSKYYYEDVPARKYEPPFNVNDIKNIDYVFCSHNHIDHLDPLTLGPISKNNSKTKFIVPAPHMHVLTEIGISEDRIVPAYAEKKHELGDISFIPVAEAHEDYLTDENGNHENLGYAVKFGNITLYHAGDTIETENMVDVLKELDIDIICLPINGRDWKRRKNNMLGNMNAREAADVAHGSLSDIVIPMHYDLFSENGENPAIFTDYMYKYYPCHKFHIMAPGERFIYMK